MRVKLAFSTFLKFLALSSKARQGELRRRGSGGKGYNFWSPLARYGSQASASATNIETLCGTVSAGYRNTAQARVNNAALRAMHRVLPGLGTSFMPSLDSLVALPGAHFDVVLRPQVGFITGSGPHLVQVWATGRPKLSKFEFDIGLALIAFARETNAIGDPISIFDSIGRRLYRQPDMPEAANAAFERAVGAMEKDWEAVFGRMPPPPPPGVHPGS